MVRKLVTFMTAGLLAIMPLAANALGFGAIKLNSALNQPFNAEVELLSPTPEDLSSLKVGLASESAFLRAGIERTAQHGTLIFTVKERPNGSYYIHMESRKSIREPFMNFLVEMSWKNGRMLREYTVLLDPPGQLAQQPKAAAPVIETPATAEPEASKQAEMAEETATPFVAAPVAKPVEQPVTEQMPEQAAEKKVAVAEKQPSESAPNVEKQPEQAVETEQQPAALSAVPEKSSEAQKSADTEEKPASSDMVADIDPFAGGELFPRIPLSAYREDAYTGEMAGELDYGITTKKDNLWTIAEKMRPGKDVSIYQVMMALVKANPNAFVDGNVHRLKVGQVLRIDDPGLLTAMSKQQAAKEYMAQTSQWEEYRQAASGKMAQQPVIANQVEAETAVADNASKGELRLASPSGSELKSGAGVSEDAISNDIAALRAELDQMRDQASAAHGQNKVLNARIAELEDELENMQRTISIKDNELAALQKQLSESNKAEAKPAPVTPVVEEKPVMEEKPVVEEKPAETKPVVEEKPVEPVQEEKPVEEAPVAKQEAQKQEQAKAAKEQQAKANKEKKKAPPKPKQKPKKEQGYLDIVMSYLDGIGKTVKGISKDLGVPPIVLYVALPLVLVILIVLMIVIKRRKQGEHFQESILKGGPSSVPSGGDIPSADLAQSEESSFLSDFAVSGAGAIQTEDSEVDPLTEADVFMAYGRYEAAEDRLQEAIQADPGRQELKLKLLELYKTTNNASAFEATAESMYASLGGNASSDPAWESVVAMGKQVAPGNPLFAGAGNVAAPSMDNDVLAPAGVELTDSQVMDIGLETNAFDTSDFSADIAAAEAEADDLDFNMDFGESSSPEPAAETESMDFNLGMGSATEESPAVETSSMDFDLNMGGGDSSSTESMDFDLNMGGSDDMTAGDSMDFDLDMSSADEMPADDAGSMDFNMDMGGSDTAEEAGLDFNLDMGSDTSSGPAAGSDATMMMDMGDFNMDLDASGSGSDALDMGLDATDAVDLDMSSDGDEVSTKLDLAKAYIDMGDPDGARSILDEVLEEGSEQQKSEAQQLIQQIS